MDTLENPNINHNSIKSTEKISIEDCSLTCRKHRRTISADVNEPSKVWSYPDFVTASEDETCSNQKDLNGRCFVSNDKILDVSLPGSNILYEAKSHRRSVSYDENLFSSATREISEVASRVVEQAEELVMHLWERGWRVVHHTSLPHWLRDNDYLIWGHRPQLATFQACFGSMFRMHTETINIWTHLIGFVCFVVLCISFLIQPGLKFPWQEKAVISIFFVSAILALGFSWLFHTVYCHSECVGRIFTRLDYIGITLLTFGSFVPWLHYSFYCHVPFKIVYLSFIVLLSLASIIVSSKDSFMTPNYRGVRAGLFIGLGLSGIVPCAHYMVMEGFWDSVSLSALGWLFLMAFLYISGALIYALRIPERLYPGKFDIWFQSHQIFHVFVVLAALVHLNGILEIAEHRLSRPGCNSIQYP